eukprot:2183600-Pyramimonas_sp.AAC.1
MVGSHIGPLKDLNEAKAWEALGGPPYNREDARLVVDRGADITARARAQVYEHTRKSIRTWLQQALPRGGKQVNAYLKAEDKVHVEYFETRSGVVCDPVAMMKH